MKVKPWTEAWVWLKLTALSLDVHNGLLWCAEPFWTLAVYLHDRAYSVPWIERK